VPLSYTTAQGDGNQTVFNFTWDYLLKSHVKVYIGRDIIADTGTLQTDGVHYSWSGAKQITFSTAPTNSQVVHIERHTPNTSQIAPWSDGSNLTAEALNNADLQNLYVVQEQQDRNDLGATEARSATNNSASATATANAAQATANAALSRGGGTMTGDIVMGGNRITGLTNPASGSEPVIKSYFEAQSWDNTTETIDSTETWAGDNTKIATTGAIDGRIDSKIDTAIEGDVLAGTDLTKTQTGGQVTINHSVTGASSVNNANGVVLQDLTINPRGHITGHASTDLDNRYYTKTELDAGQLSGQYYTETELLTDGVLDTRYFTQSDADARYYNLSSGEEIQSGETWAAADNKIATTAAIDARIIDLVDDVGGFVPIANETSFPTANPDVNNGAGTLVSVQVLASSYTPSAGSVTISNGAGAGNNVTISGVGTTTLPAGFGVILETTSTLHTYSFHRLTPKATEVTTVAGNNSNITTVATNIADITTVANDLNETTSEIETVANAITNVDTVGNAIANVNTAATNIANINTVASDLNETTSEIDTVAVNIANVNTVGTSIANVNTVANDLNEATSEIDTVAVNIANVNIVGNAITNVNSVGGSITDVNTVATNLTDVSNYADRYQIASSDPSTRADGSALQEGDQYFNTTSNVLKVYDGSNWNTGVTDTTGFAVSTGQTFTGNVGVPAASNSAPGVFIAGDTDTGIYSPGANLLAITASGTKVLEVGSSGIDVTGSATATSFSGNLNASQLNTGTVPTARLGSGSASSSNFLRGDNSWQSIDLTSLSANSLTSGTIPDARFPSTLPAISGANLTNVNATTLDSIDSGSFVRSDANDTLSGIYEFNSSTQDKIILSGSSTQMIRFREGSTNKAQFQWSTNGNIYIWNEEHNKGLQLGSYPSWYDGSGYQMLWHAGNDGSGSGLDADTLDGIQGSSFLRSDAADSTNSTLTIKGFAHSNTNNSNYEISTAQSADGSGLVMKRSDGTFQWQIYGQSGYYGFLNGVWAGWDLKKNIDGQLYLKVSGTEYEVYHKGNNSNILQRDSQGYYRAYNWLEFYSTTAGLYWNGGNGSGWEVNPSANWDMTFKSGNTGSSAINFRTSDNTIRGYVYANNGNEIGFLDQTGNWALRTYRNGGSGSGICYLYDQHFYSDSDNTYSLGSSSNRWNQVHASTFHGDGSNLTNLPGGGASFTATASGALAANKAVMVNSNGTVSQLATTTSPQSQHEEPTLTGQRHLTSHYGHTHAIAYDEKFHSIVRIDGGADNPNNNYTLNRWNVRVVMLNANGQLYGTMNEHMFTETDSGSSQGDEYRPKAIYSEDNEMVILIYGGDGPGRVRVCKTTTTDTSSNSNCSFSLGTPSSFESSSNRTRHLGACYDKNRNVFIIAYSDPQDSYKGYIRSCTVTGTGTTASISFGARTQIGSSNIKSCDLVYDSTSNRCYLTYMISQSVKFRYVTLASGSNPNVNLGTETTIINTGANSSRVEYSADQNKVIICWLSNNWSQIRGQCGTPGSSSVSWTNDRSLCSGNPGNSWDLIWHPITDRGFIGFINSSSYPEVQQIFIDTNNQIDSGNDHYVSHYTDSVSLAVNTDNGHALDAYVITANAKQSGDASYNYSYKVSDTVGNLVGPNYFVGFPDQAYSNGQTATIQTFGSVVEGFSGLDPGFPYYVQANGDIAKTHNDSYWPLTGLSGYDSTNQEHYPNGWQPTSSYQGNPYETFDNAPLAGLALGTDKILLGSVQYGNPSSSQSQQNHHVH